MSGGFTVSTAQLRAHSTTVDGVATDVGTAAGAAQTEGYGGSIFGVLFDGPAWLFLRPWANDMQKSITSAEASGHSIAQALALNADTYDGVEDGNKTSITKSGGSS
jgi:hypothetical protein